MLGALVMAGMALRMPDVAVVVVVVVVVLAAIANTQRLTIYENAMQVNENLTKRNATPNGLRTRNATLINL